MEEDTQGGVQQSMHAPHIAQSTTPTPAASSNAASSDQQPQAAATVPQPPVNINALANRLMNEEITPRQFFAGLTRPEDLYELLGAEHTSRIIDVKMVQELEGISAQNKVIADLFRNRQE